MTSAESFKFFVLFLRNFINLFDKSPLLVKYVISACLMFSYLIEILFFRKTISNEFLLKNDVVLCFNINLKYSCFWWFFRLETYSIYFRNVKLNRDTFITYCKMEILGEILETVKANSSVIGIWDLNRDTNSRSTHFLLFALHYFAFPKHRLI
jgi:hypothetical protein